MRVVGDEIRVQYVYSQDWTSLYHTWNLAFIIGNLDNLHLLLPKLLIPAVANADSNDYLFMRSLALWTSLNFSLFAKIEQRENVVMENASEIAKLWGVINHRHAMTYLESVKDENLKAALLYKKISVKNTAETAKSWLRDLLGH